MPNLVYDTPTPPSQLYSSGAAIAGGAFPGTSLRPRSSQPVVTSTVLPKSRLREQYRPEMDYDLDTSSSSDSTFSSTDLAARNHNNNNDSPRDKHHRGRAVEADENQAPNGYYPSPGFGDAGMGAGMDDKQRFMDVRQPGRQQQRGTYLSTRVDERSDATLDSSNQSITSESEDEVATQGRPLSRPVQQHQSGYRNTATTGNLTSTPYPGPGSSSNNVSKSAFDGMARELRKEFDRIMHAGQEPIHNNNNNLSRAPMSDPSPKQFRSRRNSAVQQDVIAASPSYVRGGPTPLPRGVQPPRPSSANVTRPASRDHDKTPTTQRTFGQEIRFPRQNLSSAPSAQQKQHRLPSPKPTVTHNRSGWQSYQPTSPFHAPETSARPGIIPPNNTQASNPSPYHADSPGKQSSVASSYPALRVPDVTGLTEGLTSPSRAESGPSSHRNFTTAGGSPVSSARHFRPSQEDPILSSALSGLRRRLEALESENARSEAKVAELQDRLAFQGSKSGHPVIFNGGSDPDAFVQRLQSEIDHLQQQIQEHNRTLSQLQSHKPNSSPLGDLIGHSSDSWQNVFTKLGEALHHLADQVLQVRRLLEEVLVSMKNSSPRIVNDTDLHQPHSPVAGEQSGVPNPTVQPRFTSGFPSHQASNAHIESLRNPVAQPTSRFSPPLRSASAPIPQCYNADFRVSRNVSDPSPGAAPQSIVHAREPLLERAERILSSLPPRSDSHVHATCKTCRRQLDSGCEAARGGVVPEISFDDSHAGRRSTLAEELPMQTVVTRALRDLEEDFAVHKRIYMDLSEDFKRMDPATPEVSRRKMLASHLRESIDVLEMKADEIKRLYDLLHYRSEMQTASEYEKIKRLARAMKTRFP